MKQSKPCQEPGCGLSKLASVHTHGHQYIAPPKTPAPRTALNHRSAEMAKFYREEYVPATREAVGKPCEVRSRVCTGTAEALHEPLSRARAGSLKLAFEAGSVPACDACNRYVSQDAEGIKWATANGLLRKATS